jgi:polyhydroxybutyrate depolymerase
MSRAFASAVWSLLSFAALASSAWTQQAAPPAAGPRSVIEMARARANAVEPPAGAERRVVTLEGVERNYWLLRPPAARAPMPVVFVLHGGAVADGRQTFREGFHLLGARDGVATVHPSGVGAGWNDGRDTPFLLARGGAADDVAFFRTMIDTLIAEGIADPGRVYVTGGSNGGMMTMRLVCELADRIAAAAPFVSLLPVKLQERCVPSRPVPIMLMLGTADRMMPFAGGPVAAMSGNDRGVVLSAADSLAFWRRQNRCGEPVSREALSDTDPADGTRVRMERSTGCVAPVEAVLVEGGGHRLPGEGPRVYADPRLSALSGISSRDLDGREVIWNFLLAQRRPK